MYTEREKKKKSKTLKACDEVKDKQLKHKMHFSISKPQQ
jgi:hypothetical protein